jgi:hypothetical protein
MTQAFQLLTVAVVGVGLACYALIIDRKEHKPRSDPRQPPLFPEPTAHPVKRDLVAR